jgi:O-antigen/teichoic acid export membrane protein
MAFGISIPMARVLGPEKLGYFNYIMWLTAMSGNVASLGVPSATGKYMAEFIGRGDTGLAHAIYRRSLWFQSVMSCAVTAAALAVLYGFGDPKHHLVSTIQILGVIPAMLVQIPTQANLANESMRTNMPGSLASNVLICLSVPVSLFLHWDLLGIASGMLVARLVDFALRWYFTNQWITATPPAQISPELKRKMSSFSWQMTYLSILSMIIWDKSDLVFLKALTPDIRQIAWFTVAYNLAEKAILPPVVFASSLSTTIMAQYGRDASRVPGMTAEATRYVFLFSMPLLFGLALVSGPLIRVLYGPKYLPAIHVLEAAALLGVLKPLGYPIDALFKATGRQFQVVVWTTACAVLDIALDLVLIPRFGATGAAVASGMAVCIQVIVFLAIGVLRYHVPRDYRGMGRVTIAALLMALVVLPLNKMLPPLAALVASPLAGAVTFFVSLRLTRVLGESDVERLSQLATVLPSFLRPLFQRLVHLLGNRDSAIAAVA